MMRGSFVSIVFAAALVAAAPASAQRASLADRVASLGLSALHLSLSHDGGVATAFVVAEC